MMNKFLQKWFGRAGRPTSSNIGSGSVAVRSSVLIRKSFLKTVAVFRREISIPCRVACVQIAARIFRSLDKLATRPADIALPIAVQKAKVSRLLLRPRWRHFVAGGAFSTALIAALGALQFIMPVAAIVTLPFSETYYAKAIANTLPDQKIAWARKAISAAPNRAENWLLMAYAYQYDDRKISERVINCLNKSYEVSALSPDASQWRLNYIFSNWRYMSVELRSMAKGEAQVYVTRTTGLEDLMQLQNNLLDSDGRQTLRNIVSSRQQKLAADYLANRSND